MSVPASDRPVLPTNVAAGLDATQLRLLQELDRDPRCSIAELGRRVGLSPPSVRERLARLEQAGVVRGYRVEVDPAALGLGVSAWVRLRPGLGQMRSVAELAQATPQVSECHRISGEDCFLLRVHVPSVPALEEVLDRFLPYGQTTSSFVVSTPVAPRNLIATLDPAQGGADQRRAAR